MKQETINFIKNEALLLVSLSPLLIILIRTFKNAYFNIQLFFYLSIICLTALFIIWILINYKKNLINYLSAIGAIICVIGLILWLIQEEFIGIYILGIFLICIKILPKTQDFNQRDNQNRSFLVKQILSFESFLFMGFSLSFLIAIYFYDNLIIYLSIILEIFLTVLIFIEIYFNNHSINTNKERKSTDVLNLSPKDYIKNLFFILFTILIPLCFILTLFLLIIGFFFFIPIDFGIGKLFTAIFLAFISLIFSIIYRKES